jgi:DNA-binding FadR family transcriptional regulator
MPRLHREVMKELVSEIVSGDRAQGEMLPREADIATDHSISRGVARETIRALEERGLVSVRHGLGATINGPECWDIFDPDVVEAMLNTGSGSSFLQQQVELWHVLMEAAAGFAAERASTTSASHIWDAFVRLEGQANAEPDRVARKRFRNAEADFYRELLDATGNPALRAHVEKVKSALSVAGHVLPAPPDEWGSAEYRRLAGAVASGDPAGARESMRALLAQGPDRATLES